MGADARRSTPDTETFELDFNAGGVFAPEGTGTEGTDPPGALPRSSVVISGGVDRGPGPTKWLAAVGAAIAVGGCVAWSVWGSDTATDDSDTANRPTAAERSAEATAELLAEGGHDPGDQWRIDLSEAAERSPQQRVLQGSRRAATIDVSTLPDGWRVDEDYSQVWPHPTIDGDWGYTHTLTLAGPDDHRVAYRVTGVWSGSVNDVDVRLRDVFGLSPRSRAMVTYQWQPDDMVRVDILGIDDRSPIRREEDQERREAFADAFDEISRSVSVVDRALPGRQQDLSGGVWRPQASPLLSGWIGEQPVSWSVSRRQSDGPLVLRIGLSAERPIIASTDNMIIRDPLGLPADRPITTAEVPGGNIIYGEAPPDAVGVLLVLETDAAEADGEKTLTVKIPVVADSAKQPVFAVPVDDRLDPIRIDFLNAGGAAVHMIALQDLAPSLVAVAG